MSQDPVQNSDEDKKTAAIEVDEYNNLSKLFKTQFRINSEECVALQESYVLQLAASKSWDTIAAGSTPRDVHVFGLSDNGLSRRDLKCNELQSVSNKAAVCGVRFANSDPNLLYVGTTDGTIFTFDLRTQAPVNKFEDNGDEKTPKKSLTCFDLNANDRVLCAGTEQAGPDTYLLFFDTRQQKKMGGYWESHSEDISQVRFHPTQPDTLASGSKDGLINVYDISKGNEDDAFQQCMNTESSVEKLQWHKTNGDSKTERDLLSCITHVNELKLYDVAESEQSFSADRETMNRHFDRTSGRDCNMVGVHSTNQLGKLMVVAGSIYNCEQDLRSLTVAPSSKQPQRYKVKPSGHFAQNKQVVRCSLYNENTQMLVTGGESGLITLWAPGAAEEKVKVELKEKTKDRNRKHKAKPY